MSDAVTVHSNAAPLIVKPREASRLLACGNTRLYELIAAGELQSFLDGRSRKITVDSIHRYIARRIQPTENNGTIHSPAGVAPRAKNRPQLR
jgi:excisionase family DNA binding protein